MVYRGSLAIALLVIVWSAVSSGSAAAPVPTPSDRAVEAQCHPYFHDACSEAMGRWLPMFGYSATWWDQATRIYVRDRFTYENQPMSLNAFQPGPEDGTLFVYGSAGPPKGRAVYDPRHRLAFYQQGCCSWSDVVAAADVSAPPKRVVTRDLTGLVTVRGIRLGQTEAAVMKIYGKSKLLPVPRNPGVSVLAYTTWRPRKEVRTSPPCGQFQNFFFRRGRLILIQLGDGC
jgi:hypothetical protein